MNKIAVSGATGFLGAAVLRRLVGEGRVVDAFVRDPAQMRAAGMVLGCTALSQPDSWHSALEGCSAFVHCAARVHVKSDRAVDPLSKFRQANVELTLALARGAAEAGVRRFVFVSSLGVNGDGSEGRPYTSTDEPNPHNAYARSKLEAEVGLAALAGCSSMEIVVVRPPLIYGPRAPGNFGTLMRLLHRGLPLPLGAVLHNRRSFVGLDNAVDLLIACIDHPAAAGHTFLVSDGEDLSTTELLQRVARAMGRTPRLLPVPPALLAFAARLTGKTHMAQQLLGSLVVDMSETCKVLGWRPPLCVDEGLRRAVEGTYPQ